MSPPNQKRREIRVLPDELASQIAAGEVVERPASVVKELVENAIDAGATRVDVDITQGGKQRIQVTDDGCGMTAQELRLALRRHATSKLRTVTDLTRIRTLGFRGEALPSVASVSRMTVVSRPTEVVEGVACECAPGQAPALRTTGCPPGTRVEVAALFFNVPARLKFLKTDRTESAHVQETLLKIGLAHPAVHLTLTEGARTALDLPRHRNLAERAAAALARRGSGTLHPIHAERGGYRLSGALGSPLAAVAGARNVYLLVNGRAVNDRLLLRMVASGYGALLPRGRYPVAVLHLRVPESEVDVNVHPQKMEVRFAEERTVAGFVRRAVSQGVTEAPWVSAAGVSVLGAGPAERTYHLGDGVPAGEGGGGGRVDGGAGRLAEASPGYGSPRPGSARPGSARPGSAYPGSAYPGSAYPGSAYPGSPRPGSPRPAWRTPDPRGQPGTGADSDAHTDPGVGSALSAEGDLLLPLPSGEPGTLRRCRFIGQLLSTYLLLEDRDGLLLVDQHAAHERVTYSRLRAALADGDAPMQRLLFPTQVSLSAAELATVEAHRTAIGRYGFDLSPLGSATVAVRAIPSLLPGADPERLLRDMLGELSETGESETVEAAQDRIIATLACHASVRAGQGLGAAEVAALLEALDRAERSGHCPHGRPVVIRLPETEIRRRFHRE